MSSAIDPLLASLARPFNGQGDTLLELRDCVVNTVKPGRCIACYFALSDRAAVKMAALCPLRQWLETHIEVIARDEEKRVLETLPLSLTTPDLESCCREIMAEFQDNRAYTASRINLEFRFKAAA